MKTYILIENNGSVIANFIERELAYKMARVYEINGYDVYINAKEITNEMPTWAKRILEINQ